MVPNRAEPSLILHPIWTALNARRTKLRDDLAGLYQCLEEQTLLADQLQARFSTLIGPLEIERLRKLAECAYLYAKHAALANRLNRGQIPSAADLKAIEHGAQRARKPWDPRIRSEMDRLRQGRTRLAATVVVSDEILAQAKRVYRNLCRRFHPDVSDCDRKILQTYWPLVRQAYRATNVDLLATLEHVIPYSKTKTQSADSWSVLRRDIRRLGKLAREIAQRLADNEQQAPLCYTQQLDDAAWIIERRNALKRDIQELEKERVKTLLEIERITMNNTVH